MADTQAPQNQTATPGAPLATDRPTGTPSQEVITPLTELNREAQLKEELDADLPKSKPEKKQPLKLRKHLQTEKNRILRTPTPTKIPKAKGMSQSPTAFPNAALNEPFVSLILHHV